MSEPSKTLAEQLDDILVGFTLRSPEEVAGHSAGHTFRQRELCHDYGHQWGCGSSRDMVTWTRWCERCHATTTEISDMRNIVIGAAP